MYEEGDIIKCAEQLYYLLAREESFLAVPIYFSDVVDNNSLFLHEKRYSLDFKNITEIKIEEIEKLFDFVNDKQKFKILKQYEQFLYDKKNSDVVRQGSIILYNDKFFYVNGTNGNKWLLFEVFDKSIIEYAEITVNGKLFSTIFDNNIEVVKNCSGIKNLYFASEQEMENIRIIKKDYKKRHTQKCKRKN